MTAGAGAARACLLREWGLTERQVALPDACRLVRRAVPGTEMGGGLVALPRRPRLLSVLRAGEREGALSSAGRSQLRLMTLLFLNGLPACAPGRAGIRESGRGRAPAPASRHVHSPRPAGLHVDLRWRRGSLSLSLLPPLLSIPAPVCPFIGAGQPPRRRLHRARNRRR